MCRDIGIDTSGVVWDCGWFVVFSFLSWNELDLCLLGGHELSIEIF